MTEKTFDTIVSTLINAEIRAEENNDEFRTHDAAIASIKSALAELKELMPTLVKKDRRHMNGMDKNNTTRKKSAWREKDIFPGEWVGTDHEKELSKRIELNDNAKVVVDSQFQDTYEDGTKLARCIGKVGKVIEIDEMDEWTYKLFFKDGSTNWFKRYAIEKQ